MSNVIPFPDLKHQNIIKECKSIIAENVAELIDEIKPRLKMIVGDLSYIGREDLTCLTIINSAGDRYLLTMKFKPV